jgi:hypothetical protein
MDRTMYEDVVTFWLFGIATRLGASWAGVWQASREL